jgi:hypothetical protein
MKKVKPAQAATILGKKDYSQSALMKKIVKYLQLRAEKHNTARRSAQTTDELERLNAITHDLHMPYFDENMCAGEVWLWLYLKRTNQEGKFVDMLHHVNTWSSKQFAQNKEREDKKIEAFLNHVMFLHHHKQIDSTVERHTPDKSFAMMLGDEQEQVDPAEFSLTFVFSKSELVRLLRSCVFENKMLMFGNDFHAVGGMLQNGIYYFFDPSGKKHACLLETDNVEQFAELIFKGLAVFCKSKDYIALNMSVYDLTGSPKPKTYPKSIDYFNYMFSNKVLQHPNILRVAMRYDRRLANELYKRGYKPNKKNSHMLSEVEEYVAERDRTRVKYLATHGADLDHRPIGGESAVGMAIRCNFNEMLFQLLLLGADPNAPPRTGLTPLEYAISLRNTEAIIILRAFGAVPTQKFTKALNQQLFPHEINNIEVKAAQLNNRIDAANRNTPPQTQRSTAPMLLLFSRPRIAQADIDLSYEDAMQPQMDNSRRGHGRAMQTI